MAKHVISTREAPEAIGPYSQAVHSGNLVFLSGQIPLDPKTGGVIPDASIGAQTRQVLDNMSAILSAAGASIGHVVKTTVFLTDMRDFTEMNAVYREFFREAPPARSTVAVDGLPKGVLVEVDCIASLD